MFRAKLSCRQQGTQSLLQVFRIADFEDRLPFGPGRSNIVQFKRDLSRQAIEQVFPQTEFQRLLGLCDARECVRIRSTAEVFNIIKYFCWTREHHRRCENRLGRHKIETPQRRRFRQPSGCSSTRCNETQFRLADSLSSHTVVLPNQILHIGKAAALEWQLALLRSGRHLA